MLVIAACPRRGWRRAVGPGLLLLIAAACATGGLSTGSCDLPNQTCGGQCVDLTSDRNNCGACQVTCSSGQSCSQSKCVSGAGDGGNPGDSGKGVDGGNCTMGQSSCGGMCFDLQTDPNHCGGCTTTCLSGVETCTAGSCTSTCTMGMTLCIPDGGTTVDGGPTAHCANLMTDLPDCGACFNACPGGDTCVAGKCTSTLLGSGTAADPWHTATALANCAAYLSMFPSATDGVYTTHPSTADIGVYCDMTHGGKTYEDFGFGQYSGSYTGYAVTALADFTGTTEFAAAFAYLYTRNKGLTNISPGGWSDTNCCIVVSGGGADLALGGSTYMEPAVSGVVDCATTYSAAYIELTLETSGTVESAFTQSQASSATTSTTCALGGSPAIFVKKY